MKYAVSLTLSLSLASLMYGVEPENGSQKRVAASAEVLSDILHAKLFDVVDGGTKSNRVGNVVHRRGFVAFPAHDLGCHAIDVIGPFFLAPDGCYFFTFDAMLQKSPSSEQG